MNQSERDALQRLCETAGSGAIPALLAALAAAERERDEALADRDHFIDANRQTAQIAQSWGAERDSLRAQLARYEAVVQAADDDAKRYRRLRVLGCAPYGTEHLTHGLVICFTSLDAFVDADIAAHPSRGEALPGPDALEPKRHTANCDSDTAIANAHGFESWCSCGPDAGEVAK